VGSNPDPFLLQKERSKAHPKEKRTDIPPAKNLLVGGAFAEPIGENPSGPIYVHLCFMATINDPCVPTVVI
jgi:hypothetical protein